MTDVQRTGDTTNARAEVASMMLYLIRVIEHELPAVDESDPAEASGAYYLREEIKKAEAMASGLLIGHRDSKSANVPLTSEASSDDEWQRGYLEGYRCASALRPETAYSIKERAEFRRIDKIRSISEMLRELEALQPSMRTVVLELACQESSCQFTWSWLAGRLNFDVPDRESPRVSPGHTLIAFESPTECEPCGEVWDAAVWVTCPRCQVTALQKVAEAARRWRKHRTKGYTGGDLTIDPLIDAVDALGERLAKAPVKP